MFSRRLSLVALVAAAALAFGPATAHADGAAPAKSASDSVLRGYEGWPVGGVKIRATTGSQRFRVLVADSPERQERGLMFVKHLRSGIGMVFPQTPPQVVRMWMKNTLIPLDMLFLDANHRVIYICENAPVESLDLITTDENAAAVLEIAGGESARRGIRVGDQFSATGIAALK